MDGLLSGKIALVTGTGRGIGQETVKQFALQGATVYANDRREGSLDKIIGELRNRCDAAIIPLYFDVTDTAAAKSAMMRIKKEQGRLDVLVNNAGIMKDALIGMITGEMMRETFATNVFAAMELIQLSSKLMTRQMSGSIINLASIVGVNGNKGQLVYSASKGAVIAMTKTAAKELAPCNIRVNAIAPGYIDTDMFNSIPLDFRREKIGTIGMGRIGTPEDVAKVCVFLASDLSNYVTGQILGVDGGAIA